MPQRAVQWPLFAVLVVGLASVASSQVVISQIFGGGNNSGAPYRNDFVELFNAGTTTADLAGWSLQYRNVNDTTGLGWTRTMLVGTIPPGGYFLVWESATTGGQNGQTLPPADQDANTNNYGSINLSSSNGKIVLMITTD